MWSQGQREIEQSRNTALASDAAQPKDHSKPSDQTQRRRCRITTVRVWGTSNSACAEERNGNATCTIISSTSNLFGARAHIHTYTHTYIHTYIHAYIYARCQK